MFARTLTLTANDQELMVAEEFHPHDSASAARLASVSGFAFAPSDRLLTSTDADALGILHGRRLMRLQWRRAEVAHAFWRRTRGAQLVTLVFARRAVEMTLGLYSTSSDAEAQAFVDANIDKPITDSEVRNVNDYLSVSEYRVPGSAAPRSWTMPDVRLHL